MSKTEPSRNTNLPLPESQYRDLGIASRATFWRWQKEGLRVMKIGGRRFIRPKELDAFMAAKAETSLKTFGGHDQHTHETPTKYRNPPSEG